MVSLEAKTIEYLGWTNLAKMKLKTIFLLLFVVYFVPMCTGAKTKQDRHIFRTSKPDNVMDVSDFSVYYDVETNETIRKMMPRPWYKPGWLLRFPFKGGRCSCEGFKCTCCTGVRIPAFNFDRKTCTILTYEPEESMLDMQVMMNNETIFKNTYSARNPPPFCVPIPVPYLPPGLVDMCIRLFDINLVGQRLHVCMDMDTRIDKAPVVVLHFDCMDMGFDGVGLSKPGGSSSNISNDAEGSTTTPEPTQVAYDIYDTVTESYTTTEVLFNNTVKYI